MIGLEMYKSRGFDGQDLNSAVQFKTLVQQKKQASNYHSSSRLKKEKQASGSMRSAIILTMAAFLGQTIAQGVSPEA